MSEETCHRGTKWLRLKGLRLATLFAVAHLVLVASAWAEGEWKWKWENGFDLGDPDDKFKLKFGGRLQADYTFVDADDVLESATEGDGFEFRRARFFFQGTIYERVEFKAQYDFAGGDAEFKDVYIGIKNSWGTVRFGHFHEPFSLEELTSSKYLAFLERSLPILAFSPSRNSGIGVLGSRERLTWGAGIYYDADDFGISTNEDNINLTGRIVYRPLYENKGERLLHIGLSATRRDRNDGALGRLRFRARPEAHFSGRFVDTGSFPADSATIYDVELATVFNAFWFSGEYVNTDVDAAVVGDPTLAGYYLQAGYFLTGEHRRYKTSAGAFDRTKPKSNFGKNGGRGAWEIALRFSSLDLSDAGLFGREQEDWTLGVNWYLNPATRLMLNWVHAELDEVGEADYLLARWQVDF